MKTKTRFAALAVAVVAIAATVIGGAAALTPATIYNAIPSPTPGNVDSVGYQATQTSELGDQITFAGTNRYVTSATVLMSSWACQNGGWNTGDCLTTAGAAFSHPITLNVYNVGSGNTPGALIKSVTQTFAIPYRPSADAVKCTNPGTDSNGGNDLGKWYSAADNTCYNGLATKITFTGIDTLVPNSIIYGIAFNTNTWGANPIGAPGPYESLNVGLSSTAPSVGADVDGDAVYWNTATAGGYTDGGAGGVGIFRKDTNWSPYTPAVSFTATETPVGPPTNADQCKHDGWKSFNAPRTFKNQGDCVSFLQNGK